MIYIPLFSSGKCSTDFCKKIKPIFDQIEVYLLDDILII